MTLPSVLSGLRVADFGRFVAGPWCACLLADLGADVVRVEAVGGGDDRFVGPVADDGAGALFLQVNRNKRAMTVDPRQPRGQEVIRRLLQWADVVVANLPPAGLAAMGIDEPTLRPLNPSVVLTTIDAFGRGGPYSAKVGFDGIGQAMSGAMYLSGEPGRPTKAYVPWVDFGTASLAAYATLAAVLWRERTGEGQHVEAALLRTALTTASGALVEQAVTAPQRTAIGNRSHYGAPYDVCATTDGWVIVQVIGNALFRRWATLVGEPSLPDDPRYADDAARAAHADALCERLASWCRERTTEQALAELEQARIPASAVLSPQQALDDPHVVASGAMEGLTYGGLDRPAPVVAPPVSLSGTPPVIRRPPPTLGEHTDEVLRELRYSDEEIHRLRVQGVV